VESGVARNGDVQIAYEDFGKAGGRPLLLISGLDSQMIGWPGEFCEGWPGQASTLSAATTGTRACRLASPARRRPTSSPA
jgi:hypothetical protein